MKVTKDLNGYVLKHDSGRYFTKSGEKDAVPLGRHMRAGKITLGS